MTIDWSSVLTTCVASLPFAWYVGSNIGAMRAKIANLEGELDMLRQSVLSGFIVKNPESDEAREELRTMHREAKALYSISTEECLKVTENIARFEDAHQSLIERFQEVLRREPDDPIMLNHAAVAACKRLEIYANESFLDVRRQGIWLKQRFEEVEDDFDKRLIRLDIELRVAANDIEALQERVNALGGDEDLG